MLARRRPLRSLLALALASALPLLAACGTSGAPPKPGAAKVVVTTTQLGDLVREIGGGRAQVVQLLQPNSDPHAYEPRPDDVTALLDAPLVFESGDGLDAWMGKVVAASGGHPRV